jgi:hypothetical protein
MRAILLALLIAIVASFMGEYSIGEYLNDPPLTYYGMGRGNSPIALYDAEAEAYLYIPANSKGRFAFEYQGAVYEIIPSTNMKIQVYRREP